ncbi:MAG TPA: DNA-deoxyinosine glycosylase [Sphingomicrobium sp.]
MAAIKDESRKGNMTPVSPNELKVGMGPVAHPNVRLFILGSLPGDASLAAHRYYAHPTNQFWRLLGRVLGEELHLLTYEDRLRRLAERQVGLWDVVESAERRGSLDQAIRSAGYNRLDRLLTEFPDLRAIAFNGLTAAQLGRRALGPTQLTLIDLPSSSAANTRRFDQKAEVWDQLALYAGPKTLPRA